MFTGFSYQQVNKNQLFSYSSTTSMHIDSYDPLTVKLYSKCARNEASKNRKRTRIYSTPKTQTILKCIQIHRKKKQLCSFDMMQSREQRQKKHSSTITPAVGQYNPKIENKIKLTWDILKAYRNKSQSRKVALTATSLEKQPQQISNQLVEDNNNVQMMPTQISEQFYQQPVNKIKSIKNANYITQHQSQQKSNQKSILDRVSRVRTLKSQVDMSRMTGRQDNKKYKTINNQSSPIISHDFDLNKSIQITKTRPYIDINFQKQISRDRVSSLNKKYIVASDYSYDYSVVRPKVPILISFAKRGGRECKKKNLTEYSYTHYDYNKYTWESKSNIFKNTKTNMIDFKKQTDRILFKR